MRNSRCLFALAFFLFGSQPAALAAGFSVSVFEDETWADECEADQVGDVLVLTFEGRRLVVRKEDGLVVAE